MTRYLRISAFVFVWALAVNLILSTLGYAEDPAPPRSMATQLLDMVLLSVLPALWAAVGPMATAAITKGVNQLGAYVPRPVQVVLSSVITAVLAGLTGDAVGAAAGAGAAGQILAATKPETLLTTPKPES